MISISQKKLITALKSKKYRKIHQYFIVEGEKMVQELLKSNYRIELLLANETWLQKYDYVVKDATFKIQNIEESELKQLSQLRTPNQVLAVVNIPSITTSIEIPTNNYTLLLNNLKDPGNLGTIIRTADWFGIKQIICSPQCVDVYNTKVVQATMGSLFRVTITYANLNEVIAQNPQIPVYAAVLNGQSVYTTDFEQQQAFLLIGSESHGINKDLLTYDNVITVSVPKHNSQAESLNAAMATTAIIAIINQQLSTN